MNLIAVFIGGGIGSLLRYWISTWVIKWNVFSNFPLSTLLVNIIATLLMGLIFFYYVETRSISQEWRLFWMVGVCGGFSTFSTFSMENWELARTGNYLFLLLNIILSVGLCLLVIFLLSRKMVS